MSPEKQRAETRERTLIKIDIVINKASLGDADYVFAVIQSVDGKANYPTLVPRKDIIINEQPLIGGTLSAKLSVEVVEDHTNHYLVETEGMGDHKVMFRVNKKEGKIEPLDYKAIFTQDRLAP